MTSDSPHAHAAGAKPVSMSLGEVDRFSTPPMPYDNERLPSFFVHHPEKPCRVRIVTSSPQYG